MPRAVFDSTVLISAFLRRDGVSAELIGLADAAFTLVLSPEIIAETRRKLLTSEKIRQRYRYTDEEVEEHCRGLVELADPVHDLPPLSGVVRDPNDDAVVATAVAAGADYLVSRDKDLRVLGSYQGIAIITPEDFRGLLRSGRA
jgi:putative PIN family toxin of toxin-antitoxin system